MPLIAADAGSPDTGLIVHWTHGLRNANEEILGILKKSNTTVLLIRETLGFWSSMSIFQSVYSYFHPSFVCSLPPIICGVPALKKNDGVPRVCFLVTSHALWIPSPIWFASSVLKCFTLDFCSTIFWTPLSYGDKKNQTKFLPSLTLTVCTWKLMEDEISPIFRGKLAVSGSASHCVWLRLETTFLSGNCWISKSIWMFPKIEVPKNRGL